MIFAIYLLICGIAFPIVVGILLYKNLKKGVSQNGKTQKCSSADVDQD